jgi:hypothetical protein
MTAPQAPNVVPFRPQPPDPLKSKQSTQIERLMCWSESWRDEPGIQLPDLPADLADGLPEAIEWVKQDLAPCDPCEVLAALTTMAGRRGFTLPEPIALEMDIEVMAAWPRDLWRKAFRCVWECFEYRRLPEVPDFRKYIAADLEERQARLRQLETLKLRLQTTRLKQQWDEEARRRRAGRE